jgi:hypothetical protein
MEIKMKKFLIASLFLLSGLAVGSESINLSFNPKNNAIYEYRMEMLQNVEQNILGLDVPMKTVMKATYSMEIIDKTAQEIHAQIIFREMEYILSSSMLKMRYDSKNPVKNSTKMDKILERMFDKMIDKPIMAVIAPDGSVKSVTGMDAIVEEMSRAVAADGPAAAQARTTMKQQFGDTAMKNTLEQSFKIYPANVVRIGDSWNSETTMMVANMNIDFKTMCILKEISTHNASVAVESDIKMSSDADMKGKLAGTQIGTVIIDSATGLPLTIDMSQNAKGFVVMQGMNVPVKLTGRMKTSLEKIFVN